MIVIQWFRLVYCTFGVLSNFRSWTGVYCFFSSAAKFTWDGGKKGWENVSCHSKLIHCISYTYVVTSFTIFPFLVTQSHESTFVSLNTLFLFECLTCSTSTDWSVLVVPVTSKGREKKSMLIMIVLIFPSKSWKVEWSVTGDHWIENDTYVKYWRQAAAEDIVI